MQKETSPSNESPSNTPPSVMTSGSALSDEEMLVLEQFAQEQLERMADEPRESHEEWAKRLAWQLAQFDD
jgi:hypothetical protein